VQQRRGQKLRPGETRLRDVDHWVKVIGHFDDPAAARCEVQGEDGPTPDEEAVELCRAMFVMDRVSAEN
jgi:hypothetical protein